MSYVQPEEFLMKIELLSAARLPLAEGQDDLTLPVIPGSALKGAVRAAAELLLDRLQISHCSRNKSLPSCQAKPCLLCSLFGSRSMAGKLIFGDGLPSPAPGDLPVDESSPQIRQPWRVATDTDSLRPHSRLRSATLPPGRFQARLSATAPLLDDERKLLLSALSLVHGLGAAKSSGLGSCRLTLETRTARPVEQEQPSTQIGNAQTQARVLLVAQGPICVSRSVLGGSHRESLDYIPGAHLRAGLFDQAKRLGQAGQLSQDQVESLIDKSLRFSDCLPLGSGEQTAEAQGLPRVIPLSAVTCSSRPFGSSCSEEGDHGLFDTLVRDYVLSTSYANGFPYVVPRTCPIQGCRARLVPLSGVLVNDRIVSVRKPIASFCPIDLQTLRTIEAKHHTVSFLPAQTLFLGAITGLGDEARRALNILHGCRVRVGSFRSRGFGDLLFNILPSTASATETQPLAERLSLFNDALRDQFSTWATLWPPLSEVYERTCGADSMHWPITLLSDLLLPQWACWEDNLASALEKLLSESGIEAKVVGGAWRLGVVAGWSASCSMPRGLTRSVRAGSVFLLKSHVAQGASTEFAQMLAEIESAGIGLRNCDGYGSVSICDSFHLRRRMR